MMRTDGIGTWFLNYSKPVLSFSHHFITVSDGTSFIYVFFFFFSFTKPRVPTFFIHTIWRTIDYGDTHRSRDHTRDRSSSWLGNLQQILLLEKKKMKKTRNIINDRVHEL